MAQFGRPDSDVTVNSWTATPLWQKIDESTFSDADFISGDNNTNDSCEVGLSNVGDPLSSTGHVFRYRYRKSAAGGNARNITVGLYQGGTLIAEQTHNGISETFTAGSLTLTGTQADSITDYNDLRIRFTASGTTGGPGGNRRAVQVSWAELEVPNAPAVEYTDSGTVYLKLTPATKREVYTGSPALRGAYLFDFNHGLEGIFQSGSISRPYTVGVWCKGFSEEALRTPVSVGEPPPVGGEGAGIHITANVSVEDTIGFVEAYEENLPSTAGDSGTVDPVTGWFHAAGIFRSDSNRELFVNSALTGSPDTSTLGTPLPNPTHLFVGQFPDQSWMTRGYVGWVFVWDWELTEAQLIRWKNGEVVADSGMPYYFDFSRQTTTPDEFEDKGNSGMVLAPSGIKLSPLFQTGETPPIDYHAYFDLGTVYLKLTPSGVDEYTAGGSGTEYLDASTARVSLTPSAVEAREVTDAATVTLALTPSGTESREVTDSATVGLKLTPSAVETHEGVDSATVTLTLTPSAVEEYVPDQITVSRVQWQTGDGAEPVGITFGTTPVEGNLLIVSAMERSGAGTGTLSISGSGWTKRGGR